MPAIAFGLGSKAKPVPSKPGIAGQKRKQVLLDDDEDVDETKSLPAMENVSVLDSQNYHSPPPSKSPKLSSDAKKNGKPPQQYTNLSALHTAKKHTEQASTVNSTLYDYDAVYDSFQAPKKKATDETKATVPKYMSNLLQSAEVRKRDQLRAKERLIQREREAEGDDFADKEKFVTGAYKAQQEENRRLEEAEAAREAAEEAKRKKGGGMTGFYKDLLKKDEQRSIQISNAAEAAATIPKTKEDLEETAEENPEEKSAAQVAAELNARGAKVAINDEGEVVDKRQLLSAGLNVAPKRQTRMMAEQLEKMAEQQAQSEAEEQRALEEKAKSQKTGTDISSAKERYLERKKAQEAEKAKKSGT
jgi:coiled-coil domain-containing protein 55